MVNTNEVVSVTSEQIRAISRPSQAGAVGNHGVLSGGGSINLELDNRALGLKIPDLDSLSGGGTQPVSVGGEHKGVDDVTRLQHVQALSLGQIPKHGSAILTSGGAQGTIRRDGDSVQISGVSSEVCSELAVRERPNLHELIPTSRDNDGGTSGRRETNARDPVVVALVLDCELAVTEGVPQLHGAIARSRDNLSVVSAESNGEDVLAVINKAAGASSRVDFPKTKSSIPRTRQSVLAVGRDDDVGDEVVVALERSASEAIVSLLLGDGPDKDSLLTNLQDISIYHVKIELQWKSS